MNIISKLKMSGLPVNGMDSPPQRKSALSSSEILLSETVLTHGVQKLMLSSYVKKHTGFLTTLKRQAHPMLNGKSMLIILGKLT